MYITLRLQFDIKLWHILCKCNMSHNLMSNRKYCVRKTTFFPTVLLAQTSLKSSFGNGTLEKRNFWLDWDCKETNSPCTRTTQSNNINRERDLWQKIFSFHPTWNSSSRSWKEYLNVRSALNAADQAICIV